MGIRFYLWFFRSSLLLFLFASLFDLSAQAREPGFYQRGQEGWFWYQTNVEEDESVRFDEKSVSEIVGEQLDPLSTAWFRKNMQTFMDKAIDEPTPDNVRAYLYLQRVMMDKGSRFADVSQRVVMGDPLLDEISRRPLATYVANKMDKEAAIQRDNALNQIAKRAGLFFFYRSDCVYCKSQAPIIESMAAHHGFEVFAISIDGKPLPGGEFPHYKIDTGQAKSLSVSTVPAVFLVDPPEIITPIGQGAMSLDELNKRLILAAFQSGWINEKTYHATRPVQAGISLAMSPKDLNEKMLRDPVFLVRYLREHGGK